MIEYVLLHTLPKEHELRNTPLGELKAEYRWKKDMYAAPWRTVEVGAPKLVTCTYNELGNSWTLYDDWRVEDDWDEKRMNVIGQNGNTGDHYE